ncbi:MAG: hypothetical protein RMI91_12050 [Gemmatales bacterium]|nr:hypothetical protein [Gemmatales bacterium]MDW7995373.1 hypothetical protein [Gemmatales bacterium]
MPRRRQGGMWIAAADLTGDGVSEIVTGTGAGHPPQVKVFSGAGRPLTEFLAASPPNRNGVMVGVVTGRDGQSRIAALVGSGSSKQVRLFDPRSHRTPTPLASFRAVGAGSLGTPTDRSEVKRFDARNPTPRTLRQTYRHRAIGVTAAGYSAWAATTPRGEDCRRELLHHSRGVSLEHFKRAPLASLNVVLGGLQTERALLPREELRGSSSTWLGLASLMSPPTPR